ncbi:hypothetical protein RSOLAG1IB_02348 [Rhizoctonia solani AG-1 IB]|uniref:Uncharacterized protein n=1 Tax=Thanatephorus cucumeris (strain AG1-IB / isolate 7/3/14) TaxID=1108050 RepID=A0A0B7FJ01_THACB|nr:hypothetical protein RSOLAG1IB_02348 [Rhizoctonia solani AG-1 IB]
MGCSLGPSLIEVSHIYYPEILNKINITSTLVSVVTSLSVHYSHVMDPCYAICFAQFVACCTTTGIFPFIFGVPWPPSLPPCSCLATQVACLLACGPPDP